ncbi:cytochrome d ubiquinol oxidase subunit II [Kribbella sp. NBC_01484]|uniref:cytochrome d ubiquinol oxidase subunit II n=1 Tax=Kribbella sp. NBC_01484 TaxID=2903579 RepID=UPI002E35D098|nr:cytochrome d ubiquinol oxidase subunit II [Kribbella sp. NBC_01484]
MGLPELWFVIIAILWTGFFVLEGFDFGVGMLHRVVGRTSLERRVAINTIGPFWDGNEVWLVVGGAAIFAAFPDWYATWFSASYLAVVLLLVALIIRGVSFEFRGKVDQPGWRRLWSGTLTTGSLLAPLVLGIALGDLVAGLPIDANGEFTGTFWDLFTPFGLWTGLTMVVLCLLNGATFLGIRTTGELRKRAHRAARWIGWAGLVVVTAFAVWILIVADHGWGPVVVLVVAPAALVVSIWAVHQERDGFAFLLSAAATVCSVAGLFAALYPQVLVSSTDPANSLTVHNAASGNYALTVMSVVAAVFLPLVLLYQAWSYFVFRHRLST